MRGRGLKLCFLTLFLLLEVAPHAGAWIETTIRSSEQSEPQVAPHAGAWIET